MVCGSYKTNADIIVINDIMRAADYGSYGLLGQLALPGPGQTERPRGIGRRPILLR